MTAELLVTITALELTTCMFSDYTNETVVDDVKYHKFTLTNAVSVAENWPLRRLLATSGTTHSKCAS